MQELSDLVSQKEKILNSLESSEFLDWNDKVSKALGEIKGRDELIWSTLRILFALKNSPIKELTLRLDAKLYVIWKYKINAPSNGMEILLKLKKEKEKLFSKEHLHLTSSNKKYYFSEEILKWTEELYYLFGKVSKEDKLVYDIVNSLNSARATLTPETLKDLNNKLSLFLKSKDKYSIIL